MPTHENGAPEQPSPDKNDNEGTPQPELPRWATKSPRATTPFSEARMAAYIGPRWESTYRRKLSVFFEDPAFTVTWNWAAFFVGPMWFLYRKLFLAFAMFFVASQFLGAYLLTGVSADQMGAALLNPENRNVLIILLGIQFTLRLAAGGTANWLLFRRARFKSIVATLQQLPEDVVISRLERLGGVNLLPVALIALVIFALSIAAVAAPTT